MFNHIVVDYTLAYFLVVVLSAACGAVGCMLISDRRRDRQQLAADVTAADAAPVPAHIQGQILVGLLDDPYPQPALEAPADAGTALASTGEMAAIRTELDLDDYALWMARSFHDLREDIRGRFKSIRVPA